MSSDSSYKGPLFEDEEKGDDEEEEEEHDLEEELEDEASSTKSDEDDEAMEFIDEFSWEEDSMDLESQILILSSSSWSWSSQLSIPTQLSLWAL